MKDCLFCKIANKEQQSEVVYDDQEVIAFKDIKPKAPVHLLIIPKKHVPSLKQAEDQQLLGKLMLTAKEIAQEREAEGYKLVFNVGQEGGQLVNHLHLHLLIGEPKQWP